MRLAYIVAGIAFALGQAACRGKQVAGGTDESGSGGAAAAGSGGAAGGRGGGSAGGPGVGGNSSGNAGGPGVGGNSTGNAGGGGAAGAGARDASDDGAPTSCPVARPSTGAACAFTGNCNYNDVCNCHGCCFSGYSCTNGAFSYLGYNDGCMLGPPCAPDGGADGAVCTPGADQTCNDNPAISSLRGGCTDAGTCVCTSDASANPATGRCP